MNRRHALHVLTGGALTLAGGAALGGDTADDTGDDRRRGPYGEGLTPESSNDASMATLRLVGAGEEQVDLSIRVTKPNGDRQFDGAYAVDPGDDVVFHDVLALDAEGETTFETVVTTGRDRETSTDKAVSLARRDAQQEVVVTVRSTADVTVSTGVVSSGE